MEARKKTHMSATEPDLSGDRVVRIELNGMDGILPSVAQDLNRDEVGIFGHTVLGTSSGTTEKVRLLRNR